MATNNAVNSNAAGIVGYNGTGTYTGSTATQYAVQIGGATTNTLSNVTVGTNGQVLIGSTGAAPAFATLTSTGGSVTFTAGANTLNLESGFSSNTFLFGDGSDGSQTYDGSTTILGMAPAANVYTLTRDIFLSAGTINNGVSIIVNGFKIFCSGTLTNNGTIKYNGNDGAANGTAGAELSNTNSSINIGTTTIAIGGAGGAGNTGAGSNATNILSTQPSSGGTGGNGGLGSSGAGGAAGTMTAFNTTVTPARALLYFFYANVSARAAASGGGGGGGDGATKGGGGGSGGGVVMIYSNLVAGTGNIQANGGNGGSPASGNTGGGGGGGGGLILILSNSVSSSAISGQTITVTGGTHGTKQGTGVNGSDGNAGTKWIQHP